MLPQCVRFFRRSADFNTVIKYKLQLYADLTVSFGAISIDTPSIRIGSVVSENSESASNEDGVIFS